MPSDKQRRLIIILSAVLLAVVVVSGALLLAFPQSPAEETPSATTTLGTPENIAGSAPVSTGEVFNTTVFQRATYKALNLGLLQGGLVPVKPPATTGKANPFL